MGTELWDHYATQAPGQVVVAGPDVFNGSTGALQGFRNITGATFPLLLNGATATGGNVSLLYGERDNYIVIDQQGIIRFNARQQGYVYGAALDVPRIRALVDSLLASPVGVGDGTGAGAPRLGAAPSPFRDRLRLSFSHPGLDGASLRIEVFDLSGRRVSRLFEGVARGGATQADWDGRDASGARVSAGVYLVRARAGAIELVRRVARLR